MSRHILKVVYGAILTLFGAGLILGFVAGRASAPEQIHCFLSGEPKS